MKRDGQIIDMFWERSEAAVAETQKKYEKYCMYIAENILGDREDAEECVNVRIFPCGRAYRPPDRTTCRRISAG